MLKKIGIIDLISAVQNKVEKNTDLRCYDEVEKNTPAPFYYIEYIRPVPSDTKTMYCETHTVWIHVITNGPGKTKMYKRIQDLQEALTEYIDIPKEFNLVNQVDKGVLTIKTDPSGEIHGVVQFDFKVSYGFKAKI